ncbi:putative protein [alpha proteobacterium Q-1]|nr:pentapeptide repeat-containing protein [Iodidimonas nitroreducens]GAK33742.1 putative protein [alpha proteobacterium Q-1]
MPFIKYLIVLLFLLLAAPVHAGCTDAARPGASWIRCFMTGSQYQEVDIKNAILRESTFTRSNFTGAVMSDVDARDAKFVSAIMLGVKLDGANLANADFTKADLSKADLSGADLRGARLYQTILRGADLSGARLNGADLYQTDFSNSLWVDGTTRCAEGSIGRCK